MNKDADFLNDQNKPEEPVRPAEETEEEVKKGVAEEKKSEMITLTKAEFDELTLQAQNASQSWEKMLRQSADFENTRKRLERQQQDFIKYAHEEVMADFLNVLDDLERSVEAAEKGQENFDAFLKGIEMILAHFYDLIKKRGVTPIAAKGLAFNPLEHEALMQTETDEVEEGTVMEELQKGYKLGDRIIRTAKVKVAKKVEKKSE